MSYDKITKHESAEDMKKQLHEEAVKQEVQVMGIVSSVDNTLTVSFPYMMGTVHIYTSDESKEDISEMIETPKHVMFHTMEFAKQILEEIDPNHDAITKIMIVQHKKRTPTFLELVKQVDVSEVHVMVTDYNPKMVQAIKFDNEQERNYFNKLTTQEQKEHIEKWNLK